MKKVLIPLYIIFLHISGSTAQERITLDADLEIQAVSENVYLHISYLHLEDFGKFACNGLIYKVGNEAYIFDTPVNDSLTKKLLHWIDNYLDAEVKGVVINHYHNDCMGGLAALNSMGIESYAHNLCLEKAMQAGGIVPTNGFGDNLEIAIGNRNIDCRYFGEAHSSDNIVCWIPSEKLLFGGCMIKALNAGKGNLDDANVDEWANTVGKVKAHYPSAGLIIPGHGEYGGTELLDYTIKMFSE